MVVQRTYSRSVGLFSTILLCHEEWICRNWRFAFLIYQSWQFPVPVGNICKLFFNEDSIIGMKQFNESYNWLTSHGYMPIEDEEDEEDYEEDDDEIE